jgi:hypothetical protein
MAAAYSAPEATMSSNMMSTALALNDFLFMFTGLLAGEDLGPLREALPTTNCRQCAGRRGLGGRADLPTRMRG